MSVTTDIFTTVYVVWIAASMAALAWAYRHTVKENFFGGSKR
jgi:hypothetical protein